MVHKENSIFYMDYKEGNYAIQPSAPTSANIMQQGQENIITSHIAEQVGWGPNWKNHHCQPELDRNFVGHKSEK